jgi:cyclic-di-AMP phosphodiesterase PgpH
LAAGVAQIIIVITFNLPTMQAQDIATLATYLLSAIAGTLVGTALAPFILYLSSVLFDVTTIVQMIELSRPSHPLLQQMLLQAPGTYHHSLMVANLAEQAAERIGADALVTRVGAYYHDIGKVPNPHFFIENQLQGLNVHDHLDPVTSAALLINHVTDGLKLARQYRLPSRVRGFIAEHHGTLKTKFQYTLAQKEGGSPPDESLFTYPGPRPQSKETALVMLADGCEAVVRAQKPADVEGLDNIIRTIMADRLSERQLDESNLTLRELELIRQSFFETLRGAYHPRIQYPSIQSQPQLNATAGVDTPTSQTPEDGLTETIRLTAIPSEPDISI